MTPRTYTSPEAFKQALEQRLRSSAKSGAEFREAASDAHLTLCSGAHAGPLTLILC